MFEFAALSVFPLYSPTVTVIIVIVLVNASSYFDNSRNANSDANWANHMVVIS